MCHIVAFRLENAGGGESDRHLGTSLHRSGDFVFLPLAPLLSPDVPVPLSQVHHRATACCVRDPAVTLTTRMLYRCSTSQPLRSRGRGILERRNTLSSCAPFRMLGRYVSSRIWCRLESSTAVRRIPIVGGCSEGCKVIEVKCGSFTTWALLLTFWSQSAIISRCFPHFRLSCVMGLLNL